MPKPAKQTYTRHNPVSLSPAVGWRAVYVLTPGDEPGWVAEPLIAWCICDTTVLPVRGSTAVIPPDMAESREIHGVIMDGYAQCAQEAENFWHYLGPGQPDPVAEEVAAEQALRRKARPAWEAGRGFPPWSAQRHAPPGVVQATADRCQREGHLIIDEQGWPLCTTCDVWLTAPSLPGDPK